MPKSFERGHLHAIDHKGPFVIGEDFSPPVPAGRKLWRVVLPPAVLDELEACLRTQNSYECGPSRHMQLDPFEHLTLANGVSDALAWFVSNSQFQPEEPEIRTQIKRFKKAIVFFEAALPSEHDALGNFIHESYTGEMFLKEHLKPDEKGLLRLQCAWNECTGFIAIRERLQLMKDYVSAAGACLGQHKPLEHRKAALVRALAHTWQKLTGKWPTSGRDPDTRRQTGPFARFVRTACAVLPNELSPEPLDAAIRKTCERKTRT